MLLIAGRPTKTLAKAQGTPRAGLQRKRIEFQELTRLDYQRMRF